jgi:hypothetical protein
MNLRGDYARVDLKLIPYNMAARNSILQCFPAFIMEPTLSAGCWTSRAPARYPEYDHECFNDVSSHSQIARLEPIPE